MVFFIALTFGLIIFMFGIMLSANKELEKITSRPRIYFDSRVEKGAIESYEPLFDNE
jgi:hypothetical protein